MKFALFVCFGLIGPLVGHNVYVSDVSRPSYSSTPVGSVYWPQPQRPSTLRPTSTSIRTSTSVLPTSPQSGSTRHDRRDPDGDSIVGVAVEDYPILARIPRTNFSCFDYPQAGYYVDVEARCQVFHICQKNGGRVSFLCPNGTVFNQQYFVCDWWYNVKCGSSTLSAITNWNSEVFQDGDDDSDQSDDVVQQVGNFSTVSEPPSVSRRKVVTRAKAHERPPLSQAFF